MGELPCPDCGFTINLGPQPRVGQIVTCRQCGSDWEIINLDPLELDGDYDQAQEDRAAAVEYLATYPLARGFWHLPLI